ncbi:Pre-mRNA-splicing factor 38B, partial [Ophiophagus hannah]
MSGHPLATFSQVLPFAMVDPECSTASAENVDVRRGRARWAARSLGLASKSLHGKSRQSAIPPFHFLLEKLVVRPKYANICASCPKRSGVKEEELLLVSLGQWWLTLFSSCAKNCACVHPMPPAHACAPICYASLCMHAQSLMCCASLRMHETPHVFCTSLRMYACLPCPLHPHARVPDIRQSAVRQHACMHSGALPGDLSCAGRSGSACYFWHACHRFAITALGPCMLCYRQQEIIQEIRKGDRVTPGHCDRHKCESTPKHLDVDHMIAGMLRQSRELPVMEEGALQAWAGGPHNLPLLWRAFFYIDPELLLQPWCTHCPCHLSCGKERINASLIILFQLSCTLWCPNDAHRGGGREKEGEGERGRGREREGGRERGRERMGVREWEEERGRKRRGRGGGERGRGKINKEGRTDGRKEGRNLSS